MNILTRTFEQKHIARKVYECFIQSYKPALKTIQWLLTLMIPISLGVKLLEFAGVLLILAEYTAPLVKMLGLRGEAALVLLSGGFLNIYSAIAVIETISFSAREICIMALMTLIAHNLIIESAVQRKTGSTAWWMVTLRIATAIVAAIFLNMVLPGDSVVHQAKAEVVATHTFSETMLSWAIDTFWLVVKIIIIIYALNFLQRILDEFSITLWLSRLMSPLLRLFGLPAQASFMWLIANVIGLAWGSSVLIEQTEKGKITKKQADILNHHIAISHSLLEDTLLFAAIGVPVIWITFPRLFLAFVVVWIYRLFFIKHNSQHS
ncbi:MAG TPA: nucleoside recognition protein [Bacteroidales bacterium]|nr:nucleoside recognition protein [Bacteroidales bacterium]